MATSKDIDAIRKMIQKQNIGQVKGGAEIPVMRKIPPSPPTKTSNNNGGSNSGSK